MSDNFKTYNDALLFLDKYGIKHPAIVDAYVIAEALLRAYKDGANQQAAAPDSEGDATCNCNGLPHMPTCPLYGVDIRCR